MQQQFKRCPACQSLAPLEAGFCQKCGHSYRKQFLTNTHPVPGQNQISPVSTPATVPVTIISPQPPIPMQHPGIMHPGSGCPNCNNQAVQKVSAVVQSDTWTSQSLGA